jgi:hypothetical protein
MTWDERHTELVAHKNEHGQSTSPHQKSQLGIWCQHQRQLFKWKMNPHEHSGTSRATIHQYQIDNPVSIGFQFSQERRPQPRPRQSADLPGLPDLPALLDMADLPDLPSYHYTH